MKKFFCFCLIFLSFVVCGETVKKVTYYNDSSYDLYLVAETQGCIESPRYFVATLKPKTSLSVNYTLSTEAVCEELTGALAEVKIAADTGYPESDFKVDSMMDDNPCSSATLYCSYESNPPFTMYHASTVGLPEGIGTSVTATADSFHIIDEPIPTKK